MKKALVIVAIACLIFVTEGIQDNNLNSFQTLGNDNPKVNQFVVSRTQTRPFTPKFLVKDEAIPDHELNSLRLVKNLLSSKIVEKINSGLRNFFRIGSKTATNVLIEEAETIAIKPLIIKETKDMLRSCPKAIEGYIAQVKLDGGIATKEAIENLGKKIQQDVLLKGQNKVSSHVVSLISEVQEANQPILVAIEDQLLQDSEILQKGYYEFKPDTIEFQKVNEIIKANFKNLEKKPKIHKVYIAAGASGVVGTAVGSLYVYSGQE